MSPGADMTTHDRLDVAAVRTEFPILARTVGDRPLVYLDNAATSQKPREVIDAVRTYYERSNANVHRGVHRLSEEATALYEDARERVRRFIGARTRREIVFCAGTTAAINLVAQSFVAPRVGPEDRILITELEHHSNIVPWQLVRDRTGAALDVVPIDDAGDLLLDRFEALLGPRTRFVAVGHVSNALGTVNPVETIVAAARARGIPVLVDGAQAVPHLDVDVGALDADFYAFSAHKVYGPTGIGVLYAREELLAQMPPYQGGGDMIKAVTFERSEWNDLPYRFEAGTPNVAGAVGLGAALAWLDRVGIDRVARHEAELLAYATEKLAEIEGLRLIGTAKRRAGLVSFVVDGVHPHDVGTILDSEGIAVRTGHHCAMPVMDRFGVPATVRASFAAYNTRDEIDRLVAGIEKAKAMLR